MRLREKGRIGGVLGALVAAAAAITQPGFPPPAEARRVTLEEMQQKEKDDYARFLRAVRQRYRADDLTPELRAEVEKVLPGLAEAEKMAKKAEEERVQIEKNEASELVKAYERDIVRFLFLRGAVLKTVAETGIGVALNAFWQEDTDKRERWRAEAQRTGEGKKEDEADDAHLNRMRQIVAEISIRDELLTDHVLKEFREKPDLHTRGNIVRTRDLLQEFFSPPFSDLVRLRAIVEIELIRAQQKLLQEQEDDAKKTPAPRAVL